MLNFLPDLCLIKGPTTGGISASYYDEILNQVQDDNIEVPTCVGIKNDKRRSLSVLFQTSYPYELSR